jgi:hypothetical protein
LNEDARRILELKIEDLRLCAGRAETEGLAMTYTEAALVLEGTFYAHRFPS